jgi:hypothetical protein
LEFQLLVARVQKTFYTLQEERRKRDLKYQQCIIKLMEPLDLENRSIEIMSGLLNKENIDLASQKKKFLEEQDFLFILNEFKETSQKQLSSRKLLKTLKLSLKTF